MDVALVATTIAWAVYRYTGIQIYSTNVTTLLAAVVSIAIVVTNEQNIYECMFC